MLVWVITAIVLIASLLYRKKLQYQDLVNENIKVVHDVWLGWDTPLHQPTLKELAESTKGSDVVTSLSDTMTNYAWTLEPVLYDYLSKLYDSKSIIDITKLVKALTIDIASYAIFSKEPNAMTSLAEQNGSKSITLIMIEKYLSTLSKRRSTYRILWYFYDIGAQSFGVLNQLVFLKSMIKEVIKQGVVKGSLVSMTKEYATLMRYFSYVYHTVETVIPVVLNGIIGTVSYTDLCNEIRSIGMESELLHSVAMEGLRLSMPIQSLEIVRKPSYFNWNKSLSVKSIYMDETLYPNPTEFKANRFKGRSIFGCPAQKVAVQMVKVLLYLLLKDYDFVSSENGYVLRLPETGDE
jgi:hypothetical protein